MKEKKVWIITRRAGYNFGSSLQAYAMQKIVEKSGYPNQIIDYDELYHNLRWRIRPFADNTIGSFLFLLPGLSKLLIPGKYDWYTKRDIQQKKFKDFENKNLKLTARRYKTSKSIQKDAADCAACICGSDQIWSPLLFDPVMFLDFACKPTRKIAYAPSIGVDNIQVHNKEIKKLVDDFDFVSVREEQGASALKKITGMGYPVVLDPTLLIDREEWEKIESEPLIKEPYILCYFLGNKNIPNRFIARLKAESGLKVVNVPMFYNRVKIKDAYDTECVSPDEILSLIKNASYICTDSFHGTIFSIKYHKSFFVVERFQAGEKSNQNSRIYNLLNLIGQNERIVDNLSEPIDLQKIDYDLVDKRLSVQIDHSTALLKEALDRIN